MKIKNPKKTIIKISAIVLASAFVITVLYFFLPKRNGSFNKESISGYIKVNSFLTAICTDDYEKAFEYVCYYDKTPQEGSTLSKDEARNIWCERLSNAKSDLNSEYLETYNNLKVYMCNGNVTATVNLVYSVRGVKTYNTSTFTLYKNTIPNITDEELKYDYEETLSGKININ